MSVHVNESHEVTTAVIGAGYVGLTTAVVLTHLGYRVACGESDPAKVEKLTRGEPTIVEEGLGDILRVGLDSGRLTFVHGAAEAVRGAEFVFLCVPTPQGADGSADVSFLEGVAVEIAPHLEHGAVVVNKSTVPVGSTLLVEQLLDRPDVAVVSNPEFLREGTAIHDALHPDRIVVGADDAAAAARVGALFASTQAPLIVTDAATAETIKYASNAFLATKLSFVNAVSNLCEAVGADVRDVLLGHGLRPPHRLRLSAPRSRLGRLVSSQGHQGSPLHRRAVGLRLLVAARGHRDQRGAAGVGDDQGPRGGGRVARGTVHRGVGAHLQSAHRRPARFARRGDRAPSRGPGRHG